MLPLEGHDETSARCI